MSNQQKGEDIQLPLFAKKRKEMSVSERVQLLQHNLYQKAKQERAYKFYVLYDKVFLPYILQEAWERVKVQGGGAGIDGKSIAEIETEGVTIFLAELREDLRTQTYKPMAVKRVWIPKSDGSQRPLGVPTVRDRVAQMACKIVIEPIFEADFKESSYGFRPDRSAQDAVKQIKSHLQSGKSEVFDADLSKFFDTIPHDKLLITLNERIADKRVLYLINKWLKAPVWDGEFKGGKSNKTGTPQGGVISPLLANIYLNLMDRIICSVKHKFKQAGIELVRYADDFVLMGRQIGDELLQTLQELLEKMGLTLNKQKSVKVNAKEQPFNFLGFVFRYDECHFDKTKKFWNIRASEESLKKVRKKISETLHRIGHHPPSAVAAQLNLILKGWLNYFEIPKVSFNYVVKRKLDYHLRWGIWRYYNRKSQRKSRLHGQQAFEKLVIRHGLLDPLRFYRRA